MPLPTSLVVKNGSKILSRTSAGMPCPVSCTSTSTYSAGDKRLLVEGGAVLRRHVARAQHDAAALAHRVARVDDEIDDDLLELVEVGLDQPEIAPVRDLELDPLADQPPQHHLQFRQHVGELQHLRAQRLAPREREQLTHQTRRAIGVLADLHDVLERGIGRPVVDQQQIRIADDRGQNVVEVMRDAAGELADRLHLLALREILLQRLLLGGVERDHVGAGALAAARFRRRDEEAHRALALALDRRVDRRDVGLAFGGLGDGRLQRRVVALDDGVEQRRARVLHRRRRQLGEGAVGAPHAALGAERGERQRRRIEHALEPRVRRLALGTRRVGVRLQHQRARGGGSAVEAEGDAMDQPRRLGDAVAALEIDDDVDRLASRRRRRFPRRAAPRRRRR